MAELEKAFIAELESNIQTILDDNAIDLGIKRLVITVDSEGIKTKVVNPISRKPRKSKITPDIAQKIEAAKHAFKGRRDLVYLLTLLLGLASELKKADITDLQENNKEMLIPAVTAVQVHLTKLIKEINDERTSR